MHLTPCNRPTGVLEPAPATSLREAASDGQWDGFWCVADERYYTRCVSAGVERWFRIADDANALRLISRPRRANGIPFPVAENAVPRMIVGRYRGQAMIVGTRRRREPARGSR